MTTNPNKPDGIALCSTCNCMTHTVDGRCGKCKATKPDKCTHENYTIRNIDGGGYYWECYGCNQDITSIVEAKGKPDDELKQLLGDYNGYDFCGEKNCNGQRKANELLDNLSSLIARREQEIHYKAIEAVGEDFVEVTEYDRAINGVIRRTRTNINKIFGKE